MTAFASPTGNIVCVIAPDVAGCRALTTDWDLPPKPASCDTDWADDISVAMDKAEFRCASDAMPYDFQMQRRLAYGASIRAGDFVCRSSTAEMRCDNTRTRHGFTLSRSRYTLY